MKPSYKKLLSVLGAIGLITPFAGCEADAEEASPPETNVVATATAVVGATNAPDATANGAVTVAESGLTNAVTVTAGEGTNVNQQTTIVMRIPPTLPEGVALTTGVQEVVKLLQSGVSETVVLLYIEKSTESFDLDAADIVYLNDIGVPPMIMAAMLNHDGAGEDVLHDALNTNTVATATPPPTAVAPASDFNAAAPVEVSSNYVATAPQYGGTVVTDPNAQVQQQPVVVEQQQPAVIVTQPAVTYSYFYNSLSPYGSWVYVTDYGWCWQPTIAVTHHGWRPYLHGGRWLHSDVGWYWHSDYSWGWAPFHYGRWHSAPRVGWVWTPDYTWGPSWVTWRRSRDYCGWAPLPPRARVRPGIGFSYWGRDVGFNFSFGYSHDYYAFVPTRRFCDRRIIDHVVPTHRTVNIYKDSTVVNNYIVGNNNTIINNGVSRDIIASHTRNEIPRVRVAEASAARGRVQPDRLVQQGTETVVFRPQRPAPRLVEAHEAAVARTRAEVPRPGIASAADGAGTRRNMIASRENETPSVDRASREISGGLRATSPRGNASTSTRTEVARPQLARDNDNDIATPVFGRPAPVRPEPDRSAEILRSRTSQEARVRPSTVTRGNVPVSSENSATPSRTETVRPSRGIVPRFNGAESTVRNVPQGSSRPGAPDVSTQLGTVRGEVGRGSIVNPSTRTETARPTTVLPSGRTVPQNNSAAASPSFTRPSVTRPSTGAATPQVVRPSQPAAQSPAFSRPAPSATQSAPVTRPVPNRSVTPQPVRPGAASPTFQRSSIATAPQTIQRSAPAHAPATTTVRPIQRSESFSRPSMPAQSAPQRTVVRPQSITPVAPAQRPTMVRPQSSAPSRAPVVRSAPVSRPVTPSSGGYRSAPAPASRPAPVSRPAPSSQGSSGRGRVEIGR